MRAGGVVGGGGARGAAGTGGAVKTAPGNAPRGLNKGSAPKNGGKRRGAKAVKWPVPTAEDLDKQLDEYRMMDDN